MIGGHNGGKDGNLGVLVGGLGGNWGETLGWAAAWTPDTEFG